MCYIRFIKPDREVLCVQTESRFAIIRRILAVAFQKPLCMAGSVLLAVISSLSYFVP